MQTTTRPARPDLSGTMALKKTNDKLHFPYSIWGYRRESPHLLIGVPPPFFAR